MPKVRGDQGSSNLQEGTRKKREHHRLRILELCRGSLSSIPHRTVKAHAYEGTTEARKQTLQKKEQQKPGNEPSKRIRGNKGHNSAFDHSYAGKIS